ncbi:hypothetical protein RBH29_13345 [Herbivorax sp. ANBcel31]|uniref:hypothetical protein n=1 Tax=Herbivorax sp. ANBcel31 TaxID=3069754 RepID=UPI0027B1948F|nr:hypothetical protein [Herbivorax sp. ANBcel31]MDQ2087411.1 hypothetical protein [Herbivorax sp. ANBcel31]
MNTNCSNHEIKDLEEIVTGFLRCPLCKIAMSREEWETEINKNNTPWYKEVELNTDMWYKEAFTEFPYVIAHEYKRLYDMISNGETYGSIMQIKDAFEIALKFPILVILEGCEKKIREIAEKAYMDNAEDYNSKTQSENAKELKKFDIDSFKEKHKDLFYIVNTVLSKALAIGDWEQIGKHAAKLNVEEDMPQNAKNIYAEFIKIIKKIVGIFNTYKITNWRNDTIGHGALALEDIDNIFQEEIKKLVKALKETMALCKDCYNKIGFYTNESLLLSGNSIDINFDEIKSFKVQLKENANDFVELDPYLVHQASKLYVMDSFNKNKKCAKALNYSHGKKIYNNPLAQRLENINKALNVAAVPCDDVMDANLNAHQREKFEKLMFDKEILKPTHMHDKLLSCLNENEKGIFIFRGERGTGKTVFTDAIDELGSSSYTNDKHRIHGVMVRAWHFNSIYNSRIDSFKGGIIGKLETKVEKEEGEKNFFQMRFRELR